MILKGCQRQMVVVATRHSPLFETAYFILRSDTEPHAPSPGEMLREATRILEEHAPPPPRRLKKRHLLMAAALGTLAGAMLVGLLWWLLG